MAKEQSIRDNTYGSIVWRNCNLKAFKQGIGSWEESERKKKKNMESFEKIIHDNRAAEKENTAKNTDTKVLSSDATRINDVHDQPDTVNPGKISKEVKKKRSRDKKATDSPIGMTKLKKSKRNKESGND